MYRGKVTTCDHVYWATKEGKVERRWLYVTYNKDGTPRAELDFGYNPLEDFVLDERLIKLKLGLQMSPFIVLENN